MNRLSSLLAASLVLAQSLSFAATLQVLDEPNEFEFTVQMLKAHYGDRLKESKFLCSLPAKAALRPPSNWDCRTWTVNNVRFQSRVVMDSAMYQATPDGNVVARNYSIQRDCQRILEAVFTLSGTVFVGVEGKADGAASGWDGAIGELRFEKVFERPVPTQAMMTLSYEKKNCSLAFWIEPKR